MSELRVAVSLQPSRKLSSSELSSSTVEGGCHSRCKRAGEMEVDLRSFLRECIKLEEFLGECENSRKRARSSASAPTPADATCLPRPTRVLASGTSLRRRIELINGNHHFR